MCIGLQILFADSTAAAHAQREAELLSHLHPQEQARYHGFAQPRRRQIWLAGRELLLAALARCGLPVDARALQSDTNGAPHYAVGGVHVSLSHSGNLLAAVLATKPVGVDVEASRPRSCVAQPQRLFTRAESNYLCALPPAQRQTAFYILWTLKEALAKAAGLTLWDSLHNAEIDLQAACFRLRAPFAGIDWHCLHAGIATGWRLAVATQGLDDLQQLQCWRRDSSGNWQPQPLHEPVILHAA